MCQLRTRCRAIKARVFQCGLVLSLLLYAAFPAWSVHLPEGGPLTPIDKGRTLELKDLDSNTRRVDEFLVEGKWLIVVIWASDCHVCNREAAKYVALHNKRKDKDASVLGISIDGWENILDAEAFVDRHKLTFPNLIGAVERVDAVYRHYTGSSLTGTPTFLIFSPKGEAVASQAGAVPVDIIEMFIEEGE